MCDQWMPALKLPLTLEQFHQLPRNAAYKYEYIEGSAWLTPRAKVYHAVLDLTESAPAASPPAGVSVRRIHQRDVTALTPLFAAAFDTQQPFGSLDDAASKRAAEECLKKTTSDVDGPWVRVASFMAASGNEPIGAILITLMPEGDPTEWHAFHWRDPPPPDLLKRRGGRPHVTWIFVSPWHKGDGIGTALLGASAGVLRKLGYRQLYSTFFSANESSMLWHWRNGFELLAHPGSKRHWRQTLSQAQGDSKR